MRAFPSDNTGVAGESFGSWSISIIVCWSPAVEGPSGNLRGEGGKRVEVSSKLESRSPSGVCLSGVKEEGV